MYGARDQSLLGSQVSRFAVIDVGTNSVKFHVGEREPDGSWRTIADRAEVTRLGEGLDDGGRLGAEPISRTVEAIGGMAAEADRDGVEAIAAVGTAGMRIASNADELVDAVRERCGVEVEVIPGEEEARLAYVAATSGLGITGGSLVVFDTGGGSSQFTFGAPGRIEEQFSVNVGAARFTEQFGLDGAVPPETVAAARNAIGVRPCPPRRPRGGRATRRDGRRHHEHCGGQARARALRPRGDPGNRARRRRDRPPDRALPHPVGRRAPQAAGASAQAGRGDSRGRLHRTDGAREARPGLARRQRPRPPTWPSRRALRDSERGEPRMERSPSADERRS